MEGGKSPLELIDEGQSGPDHVDDHEAAPVPVPRDPNVAVDVEALQKALSEANKQLELKEEVIKKLRERVRNFRREYPDFEWRRRWWLKMEEEAKVLRKVVEGLISSAEQVNQELHVKDEEISSLIRRIDKMKGNSCSRDPSWNVEGRDAIAIFPEEVWLMILGNLTSAKDLWNCSNTCSLFKRILQDWKKPTWLFQQAFPLLFRYLPQNKILECRLVSKGWNMVVDNYLGSHPSLRPHSQTEAKEGFDSRMLPFVYPMQEKKFYNLNKFDFRRGNVFRAEAPGFPYFPGRNPFIGRAVKLIVGLAQMGNGYGYTSWHLLDWEVEHNNDLKDTDNRSFWRSLHSFLETFGEHIWYLTLDSFVGELGKDEDDYYEYEKKMLKLVKALPTLLPNLRKLRIISSKHETYYEKFDMELVPASPNLETIEAMVTDVDGCEHLIVSALLRRNHSTLRALHVTGHVWRQVWRWGLEWSSLAELHLDRLTGEVDFRLLVETEEEGGVGLPQLRKLGVNLRGMHKSLDWLLVAIHKLFPASPLDTLRICGGIQPKVFQRIRWKFCMSPTLKTLEVEHGEGEGFYGFLVHFPLVEKVHVFMKGGPPPANPQPRAALPNPPATEVDEEEEESEDDEEDDGIYEKEELVKVDVSKFIRGRMYESNVWEVLPRLKLFTFQMDVYSRAGYNRFGEEKVMRGVVSA